MSFISDRDKVKRTWLTLLLCTLGVIVVVAGGFVTLVFSAPSGKIPFISVVPTSTQAAKGIAVTDGPDKDLIGLSDGSYAFDVNMGRAGRDLKGQVSETLRNGDRQGALALWRKELDQDTSDAEALIYQEDQLVLDSSKTYITLVIGTTLTGNSPSAIS